MFASMIAALTGTLRRVHEDRIWLESGPIVYEMLVPAADIAGLLNDIGQELTFHTILYLEGDAAGGNLEPRLIGFLRADDKRFFELFITVKGIGPKKALRALTQPVGQIARAIESRDARLLAQLPQIGKRLAEQIIATLSGKLEALAGPVAPATAQARHSSEEEAALAVLTSAQMGLRRVEAEHLLQRVRQRLPQLTRAEELVPEMLRLHAGR